MKKAFTLIELLIVIGILSILMALLFPVFAASKAAAKRTVCISHHQAAYKSTMLYVGDYDDRFMPVSYNQADASSRHDRTWVQLLMPYVTSFEVFHCPADPENEKQIESTFDSDIVPGDAIAKYYQASKLSDIGYNYLYLAPVTKVGSDWFVSARYVSEVEQPGDTYLYVDSVHNRDANGNPVGGGNWLVVPPCRYEYYNGFTQDTFSGAAGIGPEVFAPSKGWTPSHPDSTFAFGAAWAWHMDHITVTDVSGSTRAVAKDTLSRGCNVQESWTGYITEPSRYSWAFTQKFGI